MVSRIVDNTSRVWTLVGGIPKIDGVVAGSISGITSILFYNGKIHAVNGSSVWNQWDIINLSWFQLAGDPRASPNGTTIPPAIKITDNSFNVWTVVGGVIFENGSAAGSTNSVILLLWYNSTIYQENNAHNWWSWSGTAWVSIAGDPRVVVSVSPSGTVIPPASQIVDNNTNVWTVSGGQIFENGVFMTGTAQVTLLLWYNNTIYQEATSNNLWWQWTGSVWNQIAGDPRISADLTQIPPATQIVDTNLNVWTINPNFFVLQNGSTANTQSFQSHEMVFHSNLVYALGLNTNWYFWSAPSTWNLTTSPFGTGAPTQAAASGYHTLTFFDDFTSSNTIILGNVISAGAFWCCPNNSPVGSLQAGTHSVANSILTLSGGRTLQSVNEDGSGGFTLGGGWYIEGFIALDANTSTGDSNFWMMADEWLLAWSGAGTDQWPGAAAGFTHFAEIDIMEMFALPSQYDGSVQDWFGTFQNGQFAKASNNASFSTDQFGNLISTNFNNNYITVPANTDFTKYHKYGVLHVPSISGSTGSVTYYFDDQATSDQVTWVGSPPNPYNNTNPGTAPWTFSIIDQVHMLIFLSNGTGSIFIDWIKVWQSP